MKKLIKAFAIVSVLFLFVIIKVGAESGDGYFIREDGDCYKLYIIQDGKEATVMSCERLAPLFDRVNEIGQGIINIDGLEINEGVELYGSLRVKGRAVISSGGVISISGGDVIFDGADIVISGGYIRVKNGTLTALNGRISSEDTAILIDHAAGARARIVGCELNCSSEEPMIVNKVGTVEVYSGKLSNNRGAVIENDASLFLLGNAVLCGYGADVSTNSPIYLSDGKGAFAGDLRIRYGRPISDGTLTPLFYNADPLSLKGVTVFDINGNRYIPEYFESYKDVEERSFGAVYLPYIVNYYSGEAIIHSEKLLRGEACSYIEGATRLGYEFSHWTVSSIGGVPHDFKSNVNSSINLYANYRLSAPTFSLSSTELVYRTEGYTVAPSNITHPLLSESRLSYEWYKDGAIIGSAPTLRVVNVSNSGRYSLRLTLTHMSSSVSVLTPEVEILISKVVVDIPELEPQYYTGNSLHPEIYPSSLYDIDKIFAINVGAYSVPLSLRDKENYVFENGESTAYAEFRVLPAQNCWIDQPIVYDAYSGGVPSFRASSRFGTPRISYSRLINGPYSTDAPTLPGDYYCIISVPEDNNYSALASAPMSFRILSEKLVGLVAISDPTRRNYFSFESFDPEGLTVEATFNSGRREIVAADKLSVKYPTADSFRVRDSYVELCYLGVTLPVSVDVSPLEYDLSNIIFNDASVIYDGREKSISYNGSLPIGLDGIPLTAEVIGGGADAGAYTVVLSFSTESNEYRLPEAKEASLYILPYEAAVSFEALDFVYDGELKLPEAYFTDVYGSRVRLKVVGGRSLVGEYTAVAELSDKNYKLVGASAKYRILKADYDLSGIKWSNADFIYDGNEKCVSLSGLPSGVSVIGYVDNKASLAGAYKAKAALSYDERNYNPPILPEYEWTIKKGIYSLNGFLFTDAEYVYDGEEHYPTLTGSMPTGADGITLEYSFSRGIKDSAEGRCSVSITFFTKSKNYDVPNKMTAYVTVLPRAIYVEWSNTELVYNELPQRPNAVSSECAVFVSGEATDAGSYTATATSLDLNYKITNYECEFSIGRAENYWIEYLTAKDVFEGETPSCNATAAGGEVILKYYTEDKTEIQAPRSYGIYYVIAFTDGGRNYKPMESVLLRFEIIKIVPIELECILRKETFFAFEPITEHDISVFANMNNGTSQAIDFKDLRIDYGEVGALSIENTSVIISYLDLLCTLEVAVVRADLVLDGVRWSDGNYVYDGEAKGIELVGLPDGVTVVGYDGNGGIKVGEYAVKALLSYDKANFNEPCIADGIYRIERREVAIPVIPPLVYNGMEQQAKVEKSALYTVESASGTDAGVYPIFFRLTDSDNYCFEGGGEVAVASFTVEPRRIGIKVSNVEKYWLERATAPSYQLVYGSVAEGDTLFVEYKIENGRVKAVASSPNYLIESVDGVYNEYNKFSEMGAYRFFVFTLVLITILLITVVLLVRRRQIINFASIIKCRLSRVASTPPMEEGAVMVERESKTEEIMAIDQARADALITDSLAKDLIRKDKVQIETAGKRKHVINIDTLSESFSAGERVDVNRLKEMSLIPYDTAYLKVLARGMIDKPLRVYANDFSLSAVKMIALTGGEAIRVVTVRAAKGRNDEKNIK